MTLPQHPEKHGEPALVTPEGITQYFHDDPPPAPEAVVLCFHTGLFDHLDDTYRTTSFDTFGRGRGLERTGGAVGFVRVPGVGAPTAVIAMEELIARGTTTVVAVGFAGGLDSHARVGDVVVVDRALRDEGTSYHYLEPGRFVESDTGVRGSIVAALDAAETAYVVGPTWTTDAPHRETAAEVRRYRSEGILAVDMEAAAIFAVATYRSVAAGAAFAISDILDPDGWEPAFDETTAHLTPLAESVLEALEAELA